MQITDTTDAVEPNEPATLETSAGTDLVQDDLFVEDVSIDGMCGVY